VPELLVAESAPALPLPLWLPIAYAVNESATAPLRISAVDFALGVMGATIGSLSENSLRVRGFLRRLTSGGRTLSS
jgi:hypothetical protein